MYLIITNFFHVGVSRSVTIILMHLMGTYEIFLKHAYNHMKAVRPYIHPNDGFKLQLAQFEIEHLGQSSVTKNAGEDWNFFEWNRYNTHLSGAVMQLTLPVM